MLYAIMIFGFGNNLEGTHAPEFPEGPTWLNSRPLTMRGLREARKTVLIDFWTYSCVNCIRTLPHIVEWNKKYRDLGLVIIGVHTPEFEFEKDVENVKRAVQEFHIEYPVIVDSDYKVWSAWSNNVWPRKLLVDTHGVVAYDHSGEGAYRESEEVIQKVLKDSAGSGAVLPEVSGAPDSREAGGVCYPATPETYLGTARGTPGITWDIRGAWEREHEYIRHTAESGAYNDYLELRFEAFSVNIVARAHSASSGQATRGEARVKVTLDDKPVPLSMHGLHIIEEEGQTFMNIGKPQMYNVISSENFYKGNLKLYSNSDNLQLYAFTFSGCEGVHV